MAGPDPEEAYGRRVVHFYGRLGQERPSREKIRAGVTVLQSLVDEQLYLLEEIDFALSWIVDNVATKFGGRVQSLGILPHVIGEALREKVVKDCKRAKERAGIEDERRAEERGNLRRQAEEAIDALPPEVREQLRREAIAHLTEQGVRQQFLLDGLLKMEMGRLLRKGKADTA
jgi:hypothetical protein